MFSTISVLEDSVQKQFMFVKNFQQQQNHIDSMISLICNYHHAILRWKLDAEVPYLLIHPIFISVSLIVSRSSSEILIKSMT